MNTGRLYISINSLKNFKFTAKGIYSTTAGSDNGTLTIRLVDGSSTVQQTQTFSLTSTPTDYSVTYSGAIAITRADIMCTFTANETITFFCNNGTQVINYGNLFWLGYVAPDNMVRSFRNPSYPFTVSARCGLADLKDTEFPLSATTTGYTSYINLIKKCLVQNGISLPIITQCNIFETKLMTGSTKTLFNVLQANPIRFSDEKDGRLTSISAYDALDYMLQPFNCYIAQANGTWFIGALNEINTKKTVFGYTGNSYSISAYDRTVDITNSKILADSDELSKMPPLSEVELTFRNYSSTLNNSISNGTFNTNITGWHNNNWDTFAWSSHLGGSLDCGESGANALIQHTFSGSSFSVTGSSSSNYFTAYVTVDWENDGWGNPAVIIPDVAHPKQLNPQIQLYLKNPTGGTYSDSRQRLIDGVQTYGLVNPNAFPFKNNGAYTLGVIFTPDGSSPYTSYNTYFDNIQVFANTSNNTFDHFYQAQTTGSSINVQSFTTFFGDGTQSNTSGNLEIGNTLTSVWATNSGTTENLSAQQLLGKLKLVESGSFKDYLRLTVKDKATIFFNSAIKINSKTYNITNYSYDLLNNRLQLEMTEILTTIPKVYYSDTSLSTINGSIP